MKKILISLLAILLLSACTPDSSEMTEIDWNNIKLNLGTKCPVSLTTTDCDDIGDTVANIVVDSNGAPTSVNTIQTCENKRITWKYTVNVDDAPPFFIVFDPTVFPGNSTYNPISRPTRDHGEVTNQALTINARALRGTGASECLNYMIVIPDKGILDPVFIIKR